MSLLLYEMTIDDWGITGGSTGLGLSLAVKLAKV